MPDRAKDSAVAPSEDSGSYEELASEYYSGRHITSRNFEVATGKALAQVQLPVPVSGWCADIGAGCGRIHELIGIPSSRTIQLDVALSMLELAPRERAAARIAGSAFALPFADDSLCLAAAFLFDPFNDDSFFREIGRVLLPEGLFIGTLPTFEWGVQLRREIGIPLQQTEFVMEDSSHLRRRSQLSPEDELITRMTKAGLDSLLVRSGSLGSAELPVSPHVEVVAQQNDIPPEELPIVTLVVARRGPTL